MQGKGKKTSGKVAKLSSGGGAGGGWMGLVAFETSMDAPTRGEGT